jgi:chemotaxis protein histidine kinase CheA
VKEAIEKLQGKIEIKSELGVGSMFALKIPNYAKGMKTLSI